MMIRLIHALIDTLGALWVLVTLAISSGFRFKSSYWTWRMSTAFPSGMTPISRVQRAKLALEYAGWASRIRRFR